MQLLCNTCWFSYSFE